MIKLQPYFLHQDGRGLLRGITQGAWEEANYVETSAGTVRGGHYHQRTTELFYFIRGEVRIETEHLRSGERTELVAGAGDIVRIDPLEVHTFTALADTAWINILSSRTEPVDPDIRRPPTGRP